MPAAPTTFPTSPGPTFTVPRSSKAKVNKTQFGDNYFQFTPDGLNNVDEEWQLQWENLTTAEMQTLRTFLRARKGAEHFNWTTPDSEVIKVRCDTWGDQFVNAGVWNFTATFNRVYTP